MLTPEQFQQVERYIAGKGVRYYDVRVEFADHLSEQVQAAMQERGVGFIEALGEQGPIFSHDWPLIVEHKTLFAQRKILRAFRGEIMRFFDWPKIGITLPLLAVYVFLGMPPHSWINNFPLLGVNTLFLIKYYRRYDWGKVLQRDLFDLQPERDFLLGAEVKRLTLYLERFRWLCFLFFIADYAWFSPGYRVPAAPPTLLNLLIYCFFPFILLSQLAWKGASLRIYKTLIKNYPTVLSEEDKSLKEILDSLKEQH